MTTPSQEAERRKVARAALRTLLNGEWHRRPALFDNSTEQGRSRYWQKHLFKRLLDAGWLEKTDGDWRKRRYRLTSAGIEAIDRILDDDMLLTDLLWPMGTTVPEIALDETAAPGMVELINHTNHAEPEPEPAVEDSTDDEDDITPEQVQAVLLKLMGAVVEKLDRIERANVETLRILRQLL